MLLFMASLQTAVGLAARKNSVVSYNGRKTRIPVSYRKSTFLEVTDNEEEMNVAGWCLACAGVAWSQPGFSSYDDVKQRVLSEADRLPNYTCTETMEQFRRRSLPPRLMSALRSRRRFPQGPDPGFVGYGVQPQQLRIISQQQLIELIDNSAKILAEALFGAR